MDKLQQLYQNMTDKGLYTKSFEDFKVQFSTPEKQQALYTGLSEKKLYTKSFEDFSTQFFPAPVKKKDSSESISQDTQLDSDGEEGVITLTSSELEEINGNIEQENSIGFWEDLGNQLKAGATRTAAGIAGLKNFFNKTAATIVLPQEALDEINTLPPSEREVVLAGMAGMESGSILASIDAQNKLTATSESILEKTVQFEGNIIDDFRAGRIGQASRRTLQGMVNSAPSIILSLVPGGLATIAAAEASNKQEELEARGHGIGVKSIANSTVTGVSEAFFEKYTAGILKPIKGIVKGNKRLAMEVSKNMVKEIFKDIGIEASSEMATSIIQDLADKLITGEDISMVQIMKNSIDAGIIGGAMGSSMGGAKSLAGYISTKTISPEQKQQAQTQEKLIADLNKELGNEHSVEVAKALKGKINDANNEITKIYNGEVKSNESLSEEAIQDIVKIDAKANEINDEYVRVATEEFADKTTQETLLSELKEEFDKLQLQKQEIKENSLKQEVENKKIDGASRRKALNDFADYFDESGDIDDALEKTLKDNPDIKVNNIEELSEFVDSNIEEVTGKFDKLSSFSDTFDENGAPIIKTAIDKAVSGVDSGSPVGKSVSEGVQNIRESEWYQNLPQEEKVVTLENFRNSISSALEVELSKDEAVAKEKNALITAKMVEPALAVKMYDSFRTAAQDAMFRAKKLNKLLEKSGFEVTDAMNVYQMETLQKGKALNKVVEVKNQTMNLNNPNSLISKMRKQKVKYKDLGDYMVARHAPERNAKALNDLNSIKEIIDEAESIKKTIKKSGKDATSVQDKKMNKAKEVIKDLKKSLDINTTDGVIKEIDLRVKGLNEGTFSGYGMNDKDASKILNNAEGSKSTEKFEALANEYKTNVSDRALDMEFNSGMISEKSYEALKNTYKNYTPLLVETEDVKLTSAKRIGDAFSGILHIKGSVNERLRKNPIEAGIVKFNNTALNTERNKSAQALLRLAEGPLAQSELMNVINEAEYLAELKVDRKLQSKSIKVKIDGENHYIVINDADLAKTLKSTQSDKDLALLLRPLNAFNNYIRGVLTQYNPAFQLPNYIRDFQQAYFNLPADVKKKVQIPQFLRLSKESISGMADFKQNFKKGQPPKTAAGKRYAEMLEFGGISRWGIETDPKKIADKMAQSFDSFEDKTTKNYFKSILKTIDDKVLKKADEIGEYAEHANRLSVYSAAIEAGMSKDKAAFLAKESTINFDRKGTYGHIINSLFVFSNAGIQGTTRMLHTFKTNPRAAFKTLGTVMAMSAASIMAIYAMDMGEEYEKESEWDKLHNIYLPIVVDGELVKIPTPYGLNLFPYLGQKAASFGKDQDPDKLGEVQEALLQVGEEILNPLGGGFTPTIIRPINEIRKNKDFRDLPIHFEDIYTNMETVSAESGKINTGSGYKEFARFMNNLSGGSKNTNGVFDLAPEDYRHLLEGYGGGVYKMMKNTYEKATGVEDAQMPILRRFYSNPKENAGTRELYNIYKQAGGDIFSEDKMRKVDELFTKAVNESYIDKKNLVKMKRQIYVVQFLKRIAEKQNKTVNELTGKDAKKKIQKDILKKEREN